MNPVTQYDGVEYMIHVARAVMEIQIEIMLDISEHDACH